MRCRPVSGNRAAVRRSQTMQPPCLIRQLRDEKARTAEGRQARTYTSLPKIKEGHRDSPPVSAGELSRWPCTEGQSARVMPEN